MLVKTAPEKELVLKKIVSLLLIVTAKLPKLSDNSNKGDFNPSIPIPDDEKKINLNFYFRTSLWYLQRFYEGLKGLHKTFWGTTKKYENKNLS